jgi:hypothetical protein
MISFQVLHFTNNSHGQQMLHGHLLRNVDIYESNKVKLHLNCINANATY